MTSLVAYEDSDPEDDPTKQEGAGHSNLTSDFVVQNPQGAREPFRLSFSSPHQVMVSPKDGGLDRVAWCRAPVAGVPLVAPEQNSGPAHGSAAGLRPYVPKRLRMAPYKEEQGTVEDAPKKPAHGSAAGLRPYVPKRLRMAPREEEQGAVEVASQGRRVTDQPAGCRLLTEVSESVRPYLGRMSAGVELPRRVRLRIQAHQGPVNAAQWCPVPHLSHLLLTASMDRTAKVWDGAGTGQCLRTCSSHSGAVRDACWSPCGRRILTGSFDSTVHLTDVETGQRIITAGNQFRVTCLAVQPSHPDVFLCGGFSPEVRAWDARTCKVVRSYQAGIQQTLDILFLGGGLEFVTSSDSVSRDSAERTLIAWDFQTTAKVSNQIFHERYTCPCLALHPDQESFAAQTNGNYIALFGTSRPYRMNKRKRYEGHKVEGYAVGCEFSADGTVLASGSSSGSVHFYDSHSSRELRAVQAHGQACVCVTLHPVLPAVAATCAWSGELNVWH